MFDNNKICFSWSDPHERRDNNWMPDREDNGMISEPKVKIAYCIPTYKRSNLVAEFLEQFASEYGRRGIDIYIYDSSPDNETRRVAESFQRKMSFLYYFHLSEELHECEKAFRIFQKFGMKKEYDFIWLCGDSTRYAVEAIDVIMPQLSLHYDLVHVDSKDTGEAGDREYDNYCEYFTDCGWHTAVFGDLILNCHTMLKDVCWEKYEADFIREGFIGFAHVCFYFNRFLELPRFRVKHLSTGGSSYCYISKLKKRSGWYHRAFDVLVGDFVRDIDALPDCYMNKDEVIRSHIKAVLIENEESLYQFRIDGVYNADVYNRYKEVLLRVCDIPREHLEKIAFMTAEQAQAELGLRIEKRYQKSLAEFDAFVKKYAEILVYGAGIKGKRFAGYCEAQDIPISGFVVSVKHPDDGPLMGHPVYGLDELTAEQKSYGIYLALNPENQREVRKILEKNGCSENLFFSKELDDYLWFASENTNPDGGENAGKGR